VCYANTSRPVSNYKLFYFIFKKSESILILNNIYDIDKFFFLLQVLIVRHRETYRMCLVTWPTLSLTQ
jgi:hypothetical protein